MHVKTYHKTLGEGVKAGTSKAYRAAPGDFDTAARNAVRIAKRDGEEIVILPGNSYGSPVYHIARISEDLRKFTICYDAVIGATATPEGTVRMAEIAR